MPTPDLRSLGLGANCLVVPDKRSAHSGLVPISHEYVEKTGSVWAINVPQYEGFVGYECAAVEGLVGLEWETDQRLYCGSVSDIVNAVGHLWWVGHGTGEGSTRVACFSSSGPCLVLPCSTSGSVPQGSSEEGCFQGFLFLSPPTERRTLVTRCFFPSALADQWAQGPGI